MPRGVYQRAPKYVPPPAICCVHDCDRVSRSGRSGPCEAHYYRKRRTGSLEFQPHLVLGKPSRKVRVRKVRGRRISFRGYSMTMRQWAEHLGIRPASLHARFKAGWTKAEALSLRRMGGGPPQGTGSR